MDNRRGLSENKAPLFDMAGIKVRTKTNNSSRLFGEMFGAFVKLSSSIELHNEEGTKKKPNAIYIWIERHFDQGSRKDAY